MNKKNLKKIIFSKDEIEWMRQRGQMAHDHNNQSDTSRGYHGFKEKEYNPDLKVKGFYDSEKNNSK